MTSSRNVANLRDRLLACCLVSVALVCLTASPLTAWPQEPEPEASQEAEAAPDAPQPPDEPELPAEAPESGAEEETDEGIEEETEQELRSRLEALERQQQQFERERDQLEREIDEARRRAERRQQAVQRQLERERERAESQRERALERAEDIGEEIRERASRRSRGDTKLAIGEEVHVEAGEVASGIVALGAGVRVDGEVEGDVYAAGGTVVIDGRVTGDVKAYGGDVDLRDDAVVLGDVTSVGGDVKRHEDAEVLGRIDEVAISSDLGEDWGRWIRPNRYERGPRWFRFGRFIEFGWSVLWVFVLFFLGCLFILIMPTPVERVRHVASTEPLKSGVVGLALAVLFIPVLVVVTVLLALSIIGIPLLLLMPFVMLAAVVASFFGLTGVAAAVGGWADRRSTLQIGSTWAGLAAGLCAIFALALVGDFLDIFGPLRPLGWVFDFVGGVIVFLAFVIGLGAAFLTGMGTRGGPSTTLPPPPPPRPGPDDDPHAAGFVDPSADREEHEPEFEDLLAEHVQDEGDPPIDDDLPDDDDLAYEGDLEDEDPAVEDREERRDEP